MSTPSKTTKPGTVYSGGPGLASTEVFRHLVLFQLYPMSRDATDKVIKEALRLMREMCKDPRILRYEVGLSADVRKGPVLFERIDFPDEDAFKAFKATPAHEAYATFISGHADWIIGDYVVNR